MSDAKPILNLAEAPTKSGGNGSGFDFKHCRIGPAIGLQNSAVVYISFRLEKKLFHIMHIL